MNEKRLHWGLTQGIIGAFYTVYNEFGYGFLESVHKNVGVYRIDMLVADRVLVEVKASSAIGDSDNRQLVNHLRASKKQVGLLLHFGPRPAHKRLVWTGNHFNPQS